MRKWILASLLALSGLIVTPLAAVADELPPATAAASSNDSADGSGSAAMFPFGGDPAGPAPAQVSFSSQANFNGTEARGSMKATVGANTYYGDVNCLIVQENSAVVGGYIDHVQGAETFEGASANGFSLTMVDNGPTGDQLILDIGPFFPSRDVACSEGLFTGPMDQANVKVHDG